MNKKIIDEIIGWYGTVAIILSYALLNFGFFSLTDLVYQALNLTGAIGIIYISFKRKAYQPGVLNAIWAVIALIAMAKILI